MFRVSVEGPVMSLVGGVTVTIIRHMARDLVAVHLYYFSSVSICMQNINKHTPL